MRQLLEEAAGRLLEGQAVQIPLLQSFPGGVFLQDGKCSVEDSVACGCNLHTRVNGREPPCKSRFQNTPCVSWTLPT
jgi:hypothetical protein